MKEEIYPRIIHRVKAVIADSVVIVLFMFLISYVFGKIENVPDNARIIAFVFIFGLYDPIFTSLFGGTVGHFFLGIRVKRESNPNKNILFPFAIIRFMAKAILGWISLLTVSGNAKRKAIHDLIVGSVVVYTEEVKKEILSDS